MSLFTKLARRKVPDTKAGTRLPKSNEAVQSVPPADELFSTNGDYGVRILSDNTDAIIDIVFVHGLTGNRESTWTHKTAKVFWPKDLLSKDLPKARIITFGYDADITRGLRTAGNGTLRNHGIALAEDLAIRRKRTDSNLRPVIFVAHGLGGLVVEQALLVSRNSAQQYTKDLLENTMAILFMGTPHLGSNLANWRSPISKLSNLLRKSNSKIVGVLQPGSEMLAAVQQEFHIMLNDRSQNDSKHIKIFCFYEEIAFPGLGEIVPKQSAILTAYPSNGIHATHTGMTRFETAKDVGYVRVLDQLWVWYNKVEESQEPGKQLTGDTAKHIPTHYLPFSRNRHFIGRGDELHELQQKLLIQQECKKIAIVGLGGIGKTQMVLQFAQWVKRERPEYSVFWVSAVSLESFEQACTEIARVLQIPRPVDGKRDVKELVKWHLSDPAAGKWLLVVDNADDMQVLYNDSLSNGLVDFLPESDHGLTVFTSRRQEVGVALVGSDVIELGKMSEDDAVKFLSDFTREGSLDGSATEQLVAELDHLPLAIAQAAAYIHAQKVTIPDYLDLIRSTDADLIAVMSREFHDSTRKKAASAVATTWVVSFKQILAEDPEAAKLLEFMSCIEWRGIPLSILPTVQPRARMMAAIGSICSYSFLSKREDGEVYDMHRLVHLAMRIWLERSGRANHVQTETVEHITNVFPRNEYENRKLWREYLPHASRGSACAQAGRGKEMSMLDLKIGRCLHSDGRMQEAVTWLEKSCQWREKHLTEDHPDRLTSQHELAWAYLSDRQVKDAVTLLEYVVKIRERTLIETHPELLGSQHALTSVYESDGQTKKAIMLLESVVKINKRLLLETQLIRLASQHALAMAYLADGQVKEAIALLEQIVEIKKTTLIETHPSRLASQHELAIAYLADRQVKKAVALLEQIVKIDKMTLAETHPNLLVSQHGLAMAYQADGQVKEAIALLEQVVKIEETTQAETHPDQLASQHSLALAYQAEKAGEGPYALSGH